MATIKKIKEFWNERASMDVVEDKVTHPDVWQRWLEVRTIKKFLKPTDRVIDIGCGNGFTTWQLAPLVKEIVGVDYSKVMLQRAAKSKLNVPLKGALRNIRF